MMQGQPNNFAANANPYPWLPSVADIKTGLLSIASTLVVRFSHVTSENAKLGSRTNKID